jgi:hypothetical protein
MATSAFGGLGLNYLGQENAASGPGMDLGRFLLATGASASGLENFMNTKLGVGITDGKLGAYKQPTPAISGAVVPGASVPAVANSPAVNAPTTPSTGMSSENAVKTLMNTHEEPISAITPANQQQPMAQTAMMPPPSPILGGVVPSTNFDFMSGPGVRERISKAIGGLFGAA